MQRSVESSLREREPFGTVLMCLIPTLRSGQVVANVLIGLIASEIGFLISMDVDLLSSKPEPQQPARQLEKGMIFGLILRPSDLFGKATQKCNEAIHDVHKCICGNTRFYPLQFNTTP